MDEKDQEIAALKAQLACATGGASIAEASPPSQEGVPAWLFIAGGLLLAAFVFVIWTQAEGDRINAKPASERIAESCEREYGASGEEAVTACQIQLSVETIRNADRDRLERARSGAQ